MNEEEILTEAPEHELAEVASVESTGLKLIFDGETESDGKTYKCNSAVRFAAGDRVRVEKLAATYVVDFPVGNPASKFPIPSGGADGQYLVKNGTQPYALKWKTLTGLLPAGGTAGQYLVKKSETTYDCKWQTLLGTIPAGGNEGYILAKKSGDAYDCKWQALEGLLPTGGTAGQFLQKKSATKYDAEWKTLTGLLPAGGTAGQILKKNANANYDASWATLPVSGTATTIGFLGATAYSKQTVNKLASTATLANAITKVNDLLTALANYGLITAR